MPSNGTVSRDVSGGERRPSVYKLSGAWHVYVYTLNPGAGGHTSLGTSYLTRT